VEAIVLEYLKRIIARLRSSGVPFPPMGPPAPFPPMGPPEDPYDIGVRQPNRGRRPGGSAAVALFEPDEDTTATATAGDSGWITTDSGK
jgi:hypothetical protein